MMGIEGGIYRNPDSVSSDAGIPLSGTPLFTLPDNGVIYMHSHYLERGFANQRSEAGEVTLSEALTLPYIAILDRNLKINT